MTAEFFEEELAERGTDVAALANPMHNRTDVGNGRRLIMNCGDELRWCTSFESWFTWLDGKRWVEDKNILSVWKAKETAESIATEAATAADSDEAKALRKWAIASQSSARIKAMLDMARSEPGVAVEINDFDADIWLLNCLNGIVDLRTGDLQPHDPAGLHSKLVPAEYDPSATAPRWKRFVDEICCGDAELAKCLQLAVGYTSTGSTREHAAFLVYGIGSNGKSVFLNLLRKLLAGYSTVIANDTLTTAGAGQHPTAIADLVGARLAVGIELEEGARLAEALLKQLTAGDPISARRMRADFFEFVPQLTAWMTMNSKPSISGTDEGIWRRLRIVPFRASFTDEDGTKDPELDEKLWEERDGILAWIVQGAIDWYAGVPIDCAAIREATAEYRSSQDPVGLFLGEACTVSSSPTCTVLVTKLYETYASWCKDSGERTTLSRKAFKGELERRGFSQFKASSMFWRGISVDGGASDAEF